MILSRIVVNAIMGFAHLKRMISLDAIVHVYVNAAVQETAAPVLTWWRDRYKNGPRAIRTNSGEG